MIYQLPDRTYDNFGSPLNILSQFAFQFHHDGTNEPAFFDLSRVKFISPLLLCGISALCDQIIETGTEVKINSGEGISDYLETICFYAGLNPHNFSLTELDDKLKSFHNKTYLPITIFPVSTNPTNIQIREKTLSSINQILKAQLNLSGDIQNAIFYLVSELSQNVSDHSGAKFGKIMAQFYPSKNYLDLCIVDSGKGFFKSFLENGRLRPDNHLDALNLALMGESTKDNAITRGFGISTSRKMLVEGLKGKIFIWSGDAFYYRDLEREEIVHSIGNIWNGCYIALRIPTLNVKNFHFYDFLE